ncbi:MAG: DUF4339 domain-containing protein [Planctomycetales bacterium]|nr:DUF4339 domain-containing protein [Planctomycetales bacterium]
MGQWFVQTSKRQFGPFDTDKLRRLAAAGKIKPTHRISKNPDGPWNLAGNVKGLFPSADVAAAAVSTAYVPPVAAADEPPLEAPPLFVTAQLPPASPPRPSLRQRWRSMSPKRRYRWRGRILAAVCTVATVTLLVARFHQAYDEPVPPGQAVTLPVAEQPAAAAAAPSSEELLGTLILLAVQESSRKGVSSVLASPTSAVFGEPYSLEPAAGSPVDGRLVVVIAGPVDSQNAFGVMLRSDYVTWVSYEPAVDLARCESVVLGGKAYYVSDWLKARLSTDDLRLYSIGD